MKKTNIISALKITAMPVKFSSDPIIIRRNKLLTRLHEQRAMAECVIVGKPYVVEKQKILKDAEGNKTTTTVQKRVKAWFTISNGQALLEVRYGNVAIELAAGKTAIDVGDSKNIVSTLDLVIEAVNTGEFDEMLKQFDKRANK
jgi:hypothetical protein